MDIPSTHAAQQVEIDTESGREFFVYLLSMKDEDEEGERERESRQRDR
jgi:hypothetical protein